MVYLGSTTKPSQSFGIIACISYEQEINEACFWNRGWRPNNQVQPDHRRRLKPLAKPFWAECERIFRFSPNQPACRISQEMMISPVIYQRAARLMLKKRPTGE